MQHIILTRFNLSRPACDDWWAARMELFRATFASVKAQTEQRYTWLVLFDRDTATECVRQVRAMQRDLPQLLAVRYFASGDRCSPYLRSLCWPGERLLTTRLDNDDLIHPEYIRLIRERAEALAGDEPIIISAPHGLPHGRKGPLAFEGYGRQQIYNMFLSVVAPMSDEPIHCWLHGHPAMRLTGWRTELIETEQPMWTWVSHTLQQTKTKPIEELLGRDLEELMPDPGDEAHSI